MQEVITLVLGGGRGTRLYPLTRFRAKPAVPTTGSQGYFPLTRPLPNAWPPIVKRPLHCRMVVNMVATAINP